MKTKPFLALLYLLLLARLYPQGATATPGADWQWHTDAVYHFKIIHPPQAQWRLRVPEEGSRFFITSQPESESDFFLENLGCIAREMKAPVPSIFESEDMIKRTMTEQKLEVLNTVKRKWKGADNLVLEYVGVRDLEGQVAKIHVMQSMLVVDDVFYTFTYTALDSSYAKYLPTVNTMLESLVFAPRPAR